jgi:large conductance mechanosensitive channel
MIHPIKSLTKEFKEFAVKGNMVDLAVGFILGAAFNSVVKSLVDDVIMPPIGVLLAGVDFSEFKLQITSDAAITYGNFINNLVSFVITAFAVFLLVKAINKLNRKKEAEKQEEAPKPPRDEVLLEEIRDLLKK